jgi:hypothetical protein
LVRRMEIDPLLAAVIQKKERKKKLLSVVLHSVTLGICNVASVSGMCHTAIITFSTAHATLILALVVSKVSIRFPQSRVILIAVIISHSDKHVTRTNSFLLQVMPVCRMHRIWALHP